MRTILLLLALSTAACATHRNGVGLHPYYGNRDLNPVFKGAMPEVVDAYRSLTETPPPGGSAAVQWLADKPAQVVAFERLARETAAQGTADEAAGAWLLMGHAWLYVADNGRRLPPPDYTDQRGAMVWDDVVMRLIDPRFDDLESQAVERLRRAIELSDPKGRYYSAAQRTLTEIQLRRGALGARSPMY